MASDRHRWLIVVFGIGLVVAAVVFVASGPLGDWVGRQSEPETTVVTVLQPGVRPSAKPPTAVEETKGWRISLWLDGSLFKPISSVDLTVEAVSKSQDIRPEKLELGASLGAARKASRAFRLDGSDTSVVRLPPGGYRIRWQDIFQSDFKRNKPELLPLGSYPFRVRITIDDEVVFDELEVTQVSVRQLIP